MIKNAQYCRQKIPGHFLPYYDRIFELFQTIGVTVLFLVALCSDDRTNSRNLNFNNSLISDFRETDIMIDIFNTVLFDELPFHERRFLAKHSAGCYVY